MTDLEDLWASYPTPEPPVDALLRQGRHKERLRQVQREARLRRRRLVVRPLLVGTATVALGSAFLVGNQVRPLGSDSGHGGNADAVGLGPGTAGGSGLRTSAFQADLKPADSCATLLASYRSRAATQVGELGWTFGVHGLAAVQDSATASAPAAGATMDAVGSSPTGTNVQETGVDEPDDVKTDGSMLVRIDGAELTVYDVSQPTVSTTSRLTLPHLAGGQILLSGTTVVAVGFDTDPLVRGEGGTRVETVSLASPSHPRVTSDVRYTGTSVSVRQHGSTIRLILSTGLPSLPFVHPHGRLTAKQALAHNRRVVASSTLDDWLPRYDDGSGSRPLLDCSNVALPPSDLAVGTESVVGFDAGDPTRLDSIGIAGTTETAYESTDRLYLATGPDRVACLCDLAAPVRPASASTTTIFQFDLAGTTATHVASGRVQGAIAGRWSMDEADGVLRVALTHGSGHKRASAVVTMRPVGRELVEVGRVDGLGVDETVTATRWFDRLAIVSTARQTDPLYTVDLADPARPRLLGALHIPGYTSYFHPIGHDLLLGVGQKVAFDRGRERARSQVGLFDVSDPNDVRQLSVAVLPDWTWPLAANDPRAFTWSTDLHTAFTAFTTRQGVVLGEYHVSGTRMTSRLLPVPAKNAGIVRTIELPDRRVALVTGAQVSFLTRSRDN